MKSFVPTDLKMTNNYQFKTIFDHPLLLPEDKYWEYIFTGLNNFIASNIISSYWSWTLNSVNSYKDKTKDKKVLAEYWDKQWNLLYSTIISRSTSFSYLF